jgi:hypothetical protein
MIRKSVPRFSEKIMLNQSRKRDHDLSNRIALYVNVISRTRRSGESSKKSTEIEVNRTRPSWGSTNL